MGGTYNCSGSLAMRVYMAMNVLMPLPRSPLASRPVTTRRSQSLWLAPDEFSVRGRLRPGGLNGLTTPTGAPSAGCGRNHRGRHCYYIRVCEEPQHQFSFRCKQGRSRWPAISAPLALWSQLSAPAAAADRMYDIFSFTVQTKPAPERDT